MTVLATRAHDGHHVDAQLGPMRVDQMAVMGDELTGDVGDEIAGYRNLQTARRRQDRLTAGRAQPT